MAAMPYSLTIQLELEIIHYFNIPRAVMGSCEIATTDINDSSMYSTCTMSIQLYTSS